MKHRKAALAASALILLAALTGCGQQVTPSGTGINPIVVDLPDGDTVTCVSTSGGGIDCDWEGTR